MLNIYINDNEESIDSILQQANLNECIVDIDGKFFETIVTGTPEERKAIELIDKGRYNGPSEFIDRFGRPTAMTYLSTGCKTMIIVNQCKDKLVLVDESGFNARDTIICLLDSGNILLTDTGITICNLLDSTIDVQLDGYRFTSVDRLNWYIFNERPSKPDMKRKGIECIN